jgi:phenylalanyl-tRNA synthetase beta chain
MKISRTWLQTYFDLSLPSAEEIARAYTFHAFEIEAVEGDLLDVKVLPNRAADCLCHRGLAKELAAILDVPMKDDPLREFPESVNATSSHLKVVIENPRKCPRYMGTLVRGVTVAPSPDWLREALESVGQRSINNVVDATNYVMLNIGQPLHAFDAKKLTQKDGTYAVGVRGAKAEEKFTTLSGDTYTLDPSIELIVDAHTDTPLALAGVKGGKAAELTGETTDLIVESANFDGTTTRRTAQSLRLFTDASLRFQNRPSPELAAYGMRDVLALIKQIAGGEVAGVADSYPAHASTSSVPVSLARINGLLGADFSQEKILSVFRRLGLETNIEGEMFVVTPPFERTDLVIAEDLIEEVGRIIGYDQIISSSLPPLTIPPDQARFCGIERMKDQLVEQGFIEVSTQSFASRGDSVLANPLDKAKPALRTMLEDNLIDALARAKQYAQLVLAPGQKPKIFEVGTVFPKDGEYLELRMTEGVPAWGERFPTHDNLSIAKLEDYGRDYVPVRYELGAYKPFSLYPFITRDIAFWAPAGTEVASIQAILREHAGALLLRLDQFDRFEKEGRVSYAFRLIFQSLERTLTDEEVNAVMEKISAVLRAKGYEVR